MNVGEFIINNLPTILCLVVGLALVITEMVMPGFGSFGISSALIRALIRAPCSMLRSSSKTSSGV